MKPVKQQKAPTEAEILNDICRRHSTLHDIDKHLTAMLVLLTKSLPAAGEHRLLPELDAVKVALYAFHAAAKAKFEALP